MFTSASLVLNVPLTSYFHAFFIALLSFIFIFVGWISFLTFYYEIHMGEPPIRGLILAYRYNYLRKSSSLCFRQLYKKYPNYKLVKLCYCGPKSSHVEYANGIIVSEVGLKPDAYMLENLFKNGLSLFNTPSISHAISVSYPTLSWLPATKWFAIAIAYLKLFRRVKEYNLCAYPVLELYNKSSVTVMIPLLRQDEFVVKEAERLVHGRQHSAMLSPLTISSYYCLPSKRKLSKLTSPRVAKGERKG